MFDHMILFAFFGLGVAELLLIAVMLFLLLGAVGLAVVVAFFFVKRSRKRQ